MRDQYNIIISFAIVNFNSVTGCFTGSVDYPSCQPEKTQWLITEIPVGNVRCSFWNFTVNQKLKGLNKYIFCGKRYLYICHFCLLLHQTTATVHLRLDRSLRLCGENKTDTDCCPKPLCVLETLQLSACLGNTTQTSALIQAKIYAQLLPVSDGSGKLNQILL